MRSQTAGEPGHKPVRGARTQLKRRSENISGRELKWQKTQLLRNYRCIRAQIIFHNAAPAKVTGLKVTNESFFGSCESEYTAPLGPAQLVWSGRLIGQRQGGGRLVKGREKEGSPFLDLLIHSELRMEILSDLTFWSSEGF